MIEIKNVFFFFYAKTDFSIRRFGIAVFFRVKHVESTCVPSTCITLKKAAKEGKLNLKNLLYPTPEIEPGVRGVLVL